MPESENRRGACAAVVLILPILLAAVSLGSCGFFNASAFQPDLSLLQAQYDLSAYITEDEAYSYSLGVVDVGAARYVILVSPWSEGSVPLAVFDGNLTLLQQYSKGEISIAGTNVMTDAGSTTRVLVGNSLFDVGAAGLTPYRTLGSTIPNWQFGFAMANRNIVNFNVYINSSSIPCLAWCVWPADWNDAGAYTVPEVQIGSGVDYSLENVFSDPGSETAILVLMDKDSKVEYFVTVPWADFLSNPTAAVPPTTLLTKYATGTFSRDPLRADLMGRVLDYYIGFENTSGDSKVGDFIRFDAAGARDEKLHFEQLPDVRAAYPSAGDAYYLFNREKRTVSKLAPWWPSQ